MAYLGFPDGLCGSPYLRSNLGYLYVYIYIIIYIWLFLCFFLFILVLCSADFMVGLVLV